jgi:hypothetical protein
VALNGKKIIRWIIKFIRIFNNQINGFKLWLAFVWWNNSKCKLNYHQIKFFNKKYIKIFIIDA